LLGIAVIYLSGIVCASEKSVHSIASLLHTFEFTKRDIESAYNNYEIIEDLKKDGYDFNFKNNKGRNLLHYAAQMSAVHCVELLLTTNVCIDQQDNDQQTPLHLAAYWNLGDEIVRLLSDAGANKYIQDKNHKVPFDLAVSNSMKSLLVPNASDMMFDDDEL